MYCAMYWYVLFLVCIASISMYWYVLTFDVCKYWYVYVLVCISEYCLVQVGNGIELEAVGLQFKHYWWWPCGVTWDSSRTVVVIKLL